MESGHNKFAERPSQGDLTDTKPFLVVDAADIVHCAIVCANNGDTWVTTVIGLVVSSVNCDPGTRGGHPKAT